MAEIQGRVLYRKLALKSKIGGGRFADFTVQDLIKTKQEKYLAYIYYHYANISFLDEIIELLGLTPIDKPGTNEELYKQWGANYAKQFTHEQKFHGWMKVKRNIQRRKGSALARAIIDECRSKGELQAINHGHIK